MREKFYRRLRVLARMLMALLFPIRVAGLSNVPAEGAGLLCINHINLIDPITVGCALRRPVHFIGKSELFKGKFMPWFLGRLGAFPVNRGGTDLAAMRTSLQVLRAGGLLGIFPQGHRYPRDESRDMESGAAMLALRTGVSVIPIQIKPPYRPFLGVRLRVGAPVSLRDLGGRMDAEAMREATRRIAEAIWGE